MELPNTTSAWWIFARQVVIAGFLLGWCAFAYKNHIDTKDIIGIAGLMASIFGIDLTKRIAAPSEKDS